MTKVFSLCVIATLAVGSLARADDWPHWLGPKHDGVWREKGIIETFPKTGLKKRWSRDIGRGYSGPSVSQGRVVVTDQIFAQGAMDPSKSLERVLCLDEADGKVLWKHEYPSVYTVSYPGGPRCAPTIDGDKVYTLGAMGHLFCLSMADGKVLWSKNFVKDYGARVNQWGYSGHPLVDGDRLICLVGGKGGAAVVAFDKNTGKELWKALSAFDPGYCSPEIHDIGGVRQLIMWLPESVNSLNPETGAVYWTHPNAKRQIKAGVTVPTPRVFDNMLFVTSFYEGPMMLKLNGTNTPSMAWKGGGAGEQPDQTRGIHSIIPPPVVKDGHIYGVCSYGELRCLDAKTGERKWSTHQATVGKSVRWANVFLTEHEDRFFLFNEQGDLIIAKLTPEKYDEISRVHLIDATNRMAKGRAVVWVHPAYANKCIYVRNDKEVGCWSLAK